MGKWSELPEELILLISQRLSVPDLLRFGAVCLSWRLAIDERRRRHHPPPRFQSPWLMFSAGENNPNAANFFSLSEKRIYTIDLPDPPIKDRFWIGSGHGWLVTADDRSELSLLNPITRAQISLPPPASFDHIEPIRGSDGRITGYIITDTGMEYTVKKLRYHLYMKAVLSSSPSCGDYTIMLILYKPYLGLAYSRSGDSKWTLIQVNRCYRDIVCHKNQFLTVGWHGMVQAWDLSGTHPKRTLVLPNPVYANTREIAQFMYLVSSPWGELLQVWRVRDGMSLEDYTTCLIKVNRIDIEGRKLFKVDSLGDYAIFVGNNMSTCISALDVPELNENSVYFTDEYLEITFKIKDSHRDMGIYSLKNGRIGCILPDDPRLNWPSPVWFTPNLT